MKPPRPFNFSYCAATCLWLVVFAGCFRNETYSPEDRLPNGVVISDSFSDNTGMDSFFLIKATYSSEIDIDKICNEFKLEPCPIPNESVAHLFDKKHNLKWFPLANASLCYHYCSVNEDGTLKEDSEFESVDIVLWVDEENKVLILQDAEL